MHPPRRTEHNRSVLPGASDLSRQSPHFSVVMAGLGLPEAGHDNREIDDLGLS
jgi:hypothetical protein